MDLAQSVCSISLKQLFCLYLFMGYLSGLMIGLIVFKFWVLRRPIQKSRLIGSDSFEIIIEEPTPIINMGSITLDELRLKSKDQTNGFES